MADGQELSRELSDQLLPNTVVDLIMATFGISGNFVVLLMYSKYIEDKTGMRYFIPILALVDLAGCLSNVVQYHLDNTMRYIYPNIYLCKILPFLMIMTGSFSGHMIFAIALQRYLLICRPFGQQLSRKSCRMCVLLIFVFTVGCSAPVLKFRDIYPTTMERKSENVTQNITIFRCDHGAGVMAPYFGTLLFFSVINIVGTIVLYIPVIKTIYRRLSPSKQNRSTNALGVDTSKDSSNVEKITMTEISSQDVTRSYIEPAAVEKNDGHQKQRARNNISTMFLVIIIVYVVSNVTSLATHIYDLLSGIELKGYDINIYYFCMRFNLLNHVANPYIYWFYDIKFRNELRRFCCDGILRRCKNIS